jgi:hypothetical protein
MPVSQPVPFCAGTHLDAGKASTENRTLLAALRVRSNTIFALEAKLLFPTLTLCHGVSSQLSLGSSLYRDGVLGGSVCIVNHSTS